MAANTGLTVLEKASYFISIKDKKRRTIYTLYVVHVGKDILPYLPALMESLLSALTTSQAVHIKELAISAIGAIGRSQTV